MKNIKIKISERILDKVVCFVVGECEKYKDIDLKKLNQISDTSWKMAKELSEKEEKINKGN